MNSQLEIPKELVEELEKFPQAKEKFLRLPPSHKREYVAYINEAKKETTKTKRVGIVILRLLESQNK